MKAQNRHFSVPLQKAAKDLVEARRLDPGNEMIEQVQLMMLRMKRKGRTSDKQTYYRMFSTASKD